MEVEWNGNGMEMEIPLSKYQLVSNMIFLITSGNSAIMSPKSEKQCMFYVSESRSMVKTKISLFFILTQLPLHFSSIGFYLEHSDKEVRREGRDSNCIKLIHFLFGQQSSDKFGLNPLPTIQKKRKVWMR